MAGEATEAAVARAVALHRDGRLDEAAAAYRALLAADPDDAALLHNLGVVLAQGGAPAEALALFDRAIAARPGYVHAHVNRGGALQALGRLAEAAESYGRALALQDDLYPVHHRRALVLLALGRRDAAMDHFQRTRAMRRAEAARTPLRVTRPKLAHDAAQLRHLAARGVNVARFAACADLYDAAAAAIDWPADVTVPPVAPPSPWRDRLAECCDRPLHMADAPEAAGGALNPALHPAAIARALADRAPGIATIDDLLTGEALETLRRHLLDSTIWHDAAHIPGFLAAYLEDGLACPLLLQIADELRRLLPGILGPHPLAQAWAFKCLTGDRGIDVHADSGAVSVNFWVTPDDANLAPGEGGLVVHRALPPAGWAPTDYDRDAAEIRRMLAGSQAGAVSVPYAANRAVLFRAGLFHESGAVRFRPGYANHRINITLLYGMAGGGGARIVPKMVFIFILEHSTSILPLFRP